MSLGAAITLTAILVWIAVSFGNFIYAALSFTHNYVVALERSFFQFVAIAIFWGILTLILNQADLNWLKI